jgi:hydrogenase maturation protease
MRSIATETGGCAAGRVLVIGYGNSLRGDDGLGRMVAARMSERAAMRRGVGGAAPAFRDIEVIDAHQLTPELAEPLSRADLAIFIDAAIDLPAGRVQIGPVAAEADRTGAGMAHHCGPDQLLAAAANWYGHRPEAWSISVGGGCWGPADRLSPEIERLVPALLQEIDRLIARRWPEDPSHA